MTHHCYVTFRVPLRTESGREVSAVDIPFDVAFTDEQVADGMVCRSDLNVTCAGQAFVLPVEVPFSKFVGMEAVIVTRNGLTLHPQKTIEIERDKNNKLVSRTYAA
jgi:hypothetical protein